MQLSTTQADIPLSEFSTEHWQCKSEGAQWFTARACIKQSTCNSHAHVSCIYEKINMQTVLTAHGGNSSIPADAAALDSNSSTTASTPRTGLKNRIMQCRTNPWWNWPCCLVPRRIYKWANGLSHDMIPPPSNSRPNHGSVNGRCWRPLPGQSVQGQKVKIVQRFVMIGFNLAIDSTLI